MRVYKTGELRNVAVVGHGASGKTSLVDALAFVAGTSKRHGSVKDGTALTDYTADEIENKYSINLALGAAEWMDAKVNLIDTPGYLDFTGEALAGIWAADSAVVVVSATGGVEVGTEKVWDYAEQRDSRASNQAVWLRTEAVRSNLGCGGTLQGRMISSNRLEIRGISVKEPCDAQGRAEQLPALAAELVLLGETG